MFVNAVLLLKFIKVLITQKDLLVKLYGREITHNNRKDSLVPWAGYVCASQAYPLNQAAEKCTLKKDLTSLPDQTFFLYLRSNVEMNYIFIVINTLCFITRD